MPESAIRLAHPDDAAGLLGLQQALDRESDYMLLEPGERPTDPASLRSRLERATSGEDPSYTLVATDGVAVVGYADVSVLPYARARGTGYVVMGVRAGHAGRGLGRALLLAARDHALGLGVHRLELTVMEHNRRALNLYLSCGFRVEGYREAALVSGGRRISEYYMGWLLDRACS